MHYYIIASDIRIVRCVATTIAWVAMTSTSIILAVYVGSAGMIMEQLARMSEGETEDRSRTWNYRDGHPHYFRLRNISTLVLYPLSLLQLIDFLPHGYDIPVVLGSRTPNPALSSPYVVSHSVPFTVWSLPFPRFSPLDHSSWL